MLSSKKFIPTLQGERRNATFQFFQGFQSDNNCHVCLVQISPSKQQCHNIKHMLRYGDDVCFVIPNVCPLSNKYVCKKCRPHVICETINNAHPCPLVLAGSSMPQTLSLGLLALTRVGHIPLEGIFDQSCPRVG